MKIAIYGGAFNPVHNEHINIVREAINFLGLDKIIIIPTNISPHKSGQISAHPKDRLALCRLAFSCFEQAEISDEELKRGGVSYSYVTCRAIRRRYPDAEIYLLIGGDMLATFHLWKNPEDILKSVTLAVCARGDDGTDGAIRAFNSRFKRDVVKLNYVGKAVSSTCVRTLAALGGDVSEYVPAAVEKYMREHALYARPDLRAVKNYLSESRWQHTLRVAVCACENCRKFNVPEYDALTAAALHDCAKNLDRSAPELENFTPPEGVPAPVHHQYSGAYMARLTFGVTDKNIINAIKYHTSARPCMSDLEKLIYLADMLEEGRDFDGVETLRKAFSKGLDDGMEAALSLQLKYLESAGKPIYPLTLKAYKYLKENKNDQS